MTLKPSFTSFGTTSGTVATRFSPGKTSLGTPITCAMGSFLRRFVVVAAAGEPGTILSGTASCCGPFRLSH